MQTQKARVLEYMRKHGSITYREAMEQLNINSPRDIIYKLKLFHRIDSVRISVKAQDREGRWYERTYYNRYYLADELE